MINRYKKACNLIIFILIILLIICLVIPLVHDFIFDKFSISNYEVKEGIVSNVILKDKKDVGTCENIVIDNYDIFVQCGSDYKQQFKIGDKTKYYVYKGKGYHTEDQMKSSSIIGKIIDYGMIGAYILLLFLITYNKDKIFNCIDEISGNKTNL